MSASQERPSRLKLGGVVEEAWELVKTPFETNEYREEVLKLLARVVELQERRAGLRRTTTVIQTGDQTEEVNIDYPRVIKDDKTDKAGESGALQFELGSLIETVDFHYSVTTDVGTIEVEVRRNLDEDWRTRQSIDPSQSGVPLEDYVIVDSRYREMRIYASSDFSNDQVNHIEFSAKGSS